MNTLDKLARKLLRAELAARGARDLDLAEAILAAKLRFDSETGEHIGIERDGSDAINFHAPGCPAMGLDDVLGETMKARPDLFGGQSTAPGRIGQPPVSNPFAKGPGHNITEAMILYRKDPELAEKLAADAGFDLRITR